MSKFVSISRPGQENNRELQKIYFCCHPDDFGQFFHTISEDILERVDAAIWYDEDPKAAFEVEAHKALLSEMQLFVVVVTGRFLSRPSRVRNFDLEWAAQQHIPVMALLMDPQFEGTFKDKFPQFSYIKINKHDPDAVSSGQPAGAYAGGREGGMNQAGMNQAGMDQSGMNQSGMNQSGISMVPSENADERINAFLNDVLVPEDLQARIRADFDAVMYLCFRKTDRKSVAEIKKMIHAHECARDLAIIHEELLTSSDEMNEKEARAMTDACDVFGLVVSTNLIANGYQQIRDIFKYAKNLEKPVVSLEINKVNHADFYQIFTGAPACHDIRDARDMADRMQKTMDRLPSKAGKSDLAAGQEALPGQAAQHEFLMGMAYLAGIDMEIDYEKALKLLQMSAEQGNTEACRRLVLMYRRGQGVPIDEDKSFEWRSRYIDTLKASFEASPDEETAAAYCLQLMSFGALYEKHGDYQRAATIYDEARSCYDKAGNLSRDLSYDGESISYTQLLTRLADVCRRIASYYGRIGYDNAALATYYLRKDIKLRKELKDMDGSVDNTWQLIISHMNLGIFDEDTYDVKSLQEAQTLLKELTRDHPENQMYQDKLKLARDCEQKAASQKNRRPNKNRKNSGGMLDNKKNNKNNKDSGSSSRRKKGLLGRIFGR